MPPAFTNRTYHVLNGDHPDLGPQPGRNIVEQVGHQPTLTNWTIMLEDWTSRVMQEQERPAVLKGKEHTAEELVVFRQEAALFLT